MKSVMNLKEAREIGQNCENIVLFNTLLVQLLLENLGIKLEVKIS